MDKINHAPAISRTVVRGTNGATCQSYLPVCTVIAASICALTPSILKLAPFCIWRKLDEALGSLIPQNDSSAEPSTITAASAISAPTIATMKMSK